MIRNAKDLSPDQRTVIEGLLGRRVLEDEAIRSTRPGYRPHQ
jgi:hypothetical protein